MALKHLVRPRERIGIAIHSHSIYGVRVRGNDVIRSAEEALEDETLSSVARALPAVVERLATGRADVFVAIGPTRMQARHLTGLPATSDVRKLSQLVNCNAHVHFLKNGIPLAVSGVDVRAPGEGWAAAVELPWVELIHETCVAELLHPTVLVPSVVALHYSTGNAHISWRDGAVLIRAGYDQQHRIVRYERKHWSECDSQTSELRETVGLDAALGATRVPITEPLAIRPAAFIGKHSRRDVSKVALAKAAGCLFVVCVGYALIPLGIAHHLQEAAVPTAADTLAARITGSTANALVTTTTMLEGLAAFDASRVPISMFLSHLTRAIPPKMAVMDLRTDDLGGSITVLGPRISEVQSRVSALPEIASAEFSSAITSTVVGSERLERVTVRFTWRVDRHLIGRP